METAIAVVILNYNGKHFLAQFLPNVLQNSPEATVIVVDNASTDGSVDWLKTYFPLVKLLIFNQNYGFCKGYNEAFKQIEAKYFVLLNSDVEVSPHWLKSMYELLENNPQIAACQPKIKHYAQKDMWEYAGAAGGFIDFLGYPFCRGRIFTTLEKDNGQYNQATPIFWATGACLFIRADIYKQLGGLEELFFAHMEEIDLCWRIQKMGWQVYFVPQSEVYHVGGGTLPQSNPHKTFLNFRNNLALLYKNLSPKKFRKVFVRRFFLDSLALFFFICQFKFKEAKAMIKAYIAFWKMRKKLSRTSSPSETPLPTIYPKSIVWQYFFRGKKHFKNLDWFE